MRPSDSGPEGTPFTPAPAAGDPPSWMSQAAPRAASAAGPSLSSRQQRLTTQDVAVARRAARYAQHAYGGPVGDLIGRELREYAEAGQQLPPYAIGPRLVSLLTQQEARDPLPPARTYTHLPAQYVPGTPLHWRYRSIADVEEAEADTS